MSTMASASPKQREIQSRQRQILEVGFRLLDDGGLNAVRLETIAAEIGCTRGTIYNHYPNLDEVLLDMARLAVASRASLFEFAISHASTTRSKIAGVCVAAMVYADQLKSQFAIEQAVRHETVWNRTSEARQDLFQQDELRCIRTVSAVINEAIAKRELPLPAGLTVEQMIERVVFGLWSMSYGGLVLQATSPSLAAAGIRDPRSTIQYNCNALLDSFQWTPLFDPVVYQQFVDEIEPPLIAKAAELRCTDVSRTT